MTTPFLVAEQGKVTQFCFLAGHGNRLHVTWQVWSVFLLLKQWGIDFMVLWVFLLCFHMRPISHEFPIHLFNFFSNRHYVKKQQNISLRFSLGDKNHHLTWLSWIKIHFLHEFSMITCLFLRLKTITESPRRPTIEEINRKTCRPENGLNSRLGKSMPNLADYRLLTIPVQRISVRTMPLQSGEETFKNTLFWKSQTN